MIIPLWSPTTWITKVLCLILFEFWFQYFISIPGGKGIPSKPKSPSWGGNQWNGTCSMPFLVSSKRLSPLPWTNLRWNHMKFSYRVGMVIWTCWISLMEQATTLKCHLRVRTRCLSQATTWQTSSNVRHSRRNIALPISSQTVVKHSNHQLINKKTCLGHGPDIQKAYPTLDHLAYSTWGLGDLLWWSKLDF